MRMSCPWKCVGVTHEYWTSTFSNMADCGCDVAYFDDLGDGGCKADKFERDERLLMEGLKNEPMNER